MINFSSSLFSYQHTPYQNLSPQKNAVRLKELLSEIHTLDREIEKIQNTLRISSTVPLEVTDAPNLTLCPKIIQTVDTFLEQAENETSQVIELEKRILSLEKKFKLEKEKTHVEALKILKSFDEKFQNEEKLIKAKISDLHSSIANFSSQLEQKKFVSKITNLEKATPLILIKIQLLEERKKKNNRLFEEEINTIKHSLELLTSSSEMLCQTQQAITVPNTHSDEPQTPETSIPPPQSHEKPEKKKKTSNKQVQQKQPPLEKTTLTDEELLLEHAASDILSRKKHSESLKKGREKNIPVWEFNFHKDEINKVFQKSLLDCLTNPFSIFSLKEKLLNTEEFSNKPNKELVREVASNTQTQQSSLRFLELLKNKNRQIYLLNNHTKALISIDQILIGTAAK